MTIHKNIHEMKIKVNCARWLEARYYGVLEGALINEFSANKSKARADLVYVCPSEIVAVEIKSSQDNLIRLEGQISNLKTIYNRVEVVTTSKHFQRARVICLEMHAGLHLIEGDEVVTILKGRRRKIESSALYRVFPRHIRERKDFQLTEAFYRNFLFQKYGSSKHQKINHTTNFDLENENIMRLNPHYIRREKAKQRREKYYKDLESLSIALQSTHSSSNSSDETSAP
ncbi:hypothetical protein OCK02_15990 [Rhizobium sp. TRM96647]|uniref:hypothetical protein n=1 Tax=unclassified Rhizobium TaxID=2613769 RepID=UPI0021E80946|nr:MULTISPECIES: hypothetical protein [unclassified Rhizobium]MCV3737712.1 hypothetical protein [Rhizobium sp. TRM96647]MCV3759558.1 hypothetical protein [Rhizobium sp. TRM96650]